MRMKMRFVVLSFLEIPFIKTEELRLEENGPSPGDCGKVTWLGETPEYVESQCWAPRAKSTSPQHGVPWRFQSWVSTTTTTCQSSLSSWLLPHFPRTSPGDARFSSRWVPLSCATARISRTPTLRSLPSSISAVCP